MHLSTKANLQKLFEAGYTQTALSSKTGIPQSRISTWWNGTVPKSADDALKLAALASKCRSKKS